MGWAGEEFETIDLGDARLNRRAATLAEAFANSPTASIPRSSEGLAELKAAYRFFDHDRIDFWSVLGPHIRATEKRMGKYRVALVPVHRIPFTSQRFAWDGSAVPEPA